MNIRSRSAPVAVLLASVALSAFGAPRAASAAWPQLGRALCTAPGDQLGRAIAPDGVGGAIVTWLDRRSPGVQLYAQHVLATGEVDAGWPDNGRALLTDLLAQLIVPQGQEFPAILPDGAGGAIITWPDDRTSITGFDIHLHHVLASGRLDSAWPLNGTTACAAPGRQGDPVIVSDGAGGAIVTWEDGRSGDTVNDIDVYAQHVLASGVVDPGWPANGTPVCTAPAAQFALDILGDGAGGVIVTWSDSRSGNPGVDIYAQHVLSSGVVDSAWPTNGFALCTAPNTQSAPQIIPDGGSGAIVAWNDMRDGNNHIYAQRVLASGAIASGWPVNGLGVSTTGVDEVNAIIVSDGTGGAIVAWGEASGGHHDMRAKHVLSSGVVDAAWPAGGTALSSIPSEETDPVIVSDGAGGAIVTWQVNFDIFAQHVFASGALDPAFPVDGRPVCNAPDLQHTPAIVETGGGGAIVTWMDQRSGIDFDIYALQVLAAGTAGVDDPPALQGITLAPPVPNPARGSLKLRFALPRDARVTLAIYDASGRRVRELASGVEPAGEHSVAWDLRDDHGRSVSAGIYFARFETESLALTRKLVTLR